MKNIITYILVIIVLAAVTQLILPWWIIIIIALIVSFIFNLSKAKSFGGAFIALFVLWCLGAAYLDVNNQSDMGSLVMGLLGTELPNFAAYILTGVVGGVMAGLGGLIGSMVRSSKNQA